MHGKQRLARIVVFFVLIGMLGTVVAAMVSAR